MVVWVVSEEILLSISRNDKLKQKQEYCITMSWLRRKISYLLMRSVLLCIHGTLGKIVNQEEMNVANDIEISELLSKVHK